MGKLGHLEVERGVVDEHKRIGVPLEHGAARRLHETKYRGQVLGHLDKAHVGHVAIVDEGLHPRDLGHVVAAQKAKLGLAVLCLERSHELGAMQVAAGLAGNDKILHRSQR